MTLINILLIFVLVGLNAFFVSVEFAAVSARRSRLELIADPKSRSARIVRHWLENPSARDRLIAANQLGITVVSLALGAVGENTFARILEPLFENQHLPGWLAVFDFLLAALPIILSLTVVTSIHVVLGEQVPKVAVLRAPERFALFAAPVMQVFEIVFKWFVDLLDWASRIILNLFGVSTGAGAHPAISLEELKQMVSGPEVEGVIEAQEREMLSAVIDFGELVVRQVSVPRTEIIAVEADEPLDEAIRLVVEHGVSKLPVYEDSLDQVIGIIHLRELLKAQHDGEVEGRQARSLARDVLYVPETISVNDLLHQFRARRTHIAIVLDEYGGTAGLVTLEDLLDEIVGEISGPFEAGMPSIQTRADGSALIDGMTLIEDVNQFFHLELVNPDYDTIAGYVLGLLGRVAKPGDEVEDRENNIRLKVEKMDRLRIEQVLLQRVKAG